jgi:glycosyltransferase involved in cell wall biosynthesis
MSGETLQRTGADAPRVALVSVVIPVHNREHLVEGAVRSVLAQTHTETEVVIVDDGSTDGTLGVLQGLADKEPRISILTHPTSRGAQAARNTGIRASSGQWVTFLDSDDRYLPDSVALRLHEAERSSVAVVHGEARRITAAGIDALYGVAALRGKVYRQLLARPAVLFPALLVRREVLAEIGYLDETIVAWQEWETAIRLSRVAEFGFVPVATFDYDERTPGAISRDSLRAARGYEQIVRKHRRAIFRECGPRVLGDHYRTLAGLRRSAADRSGTVRCGVLSTLWWPPNIAWGLRSAVKLLRERTSSC